ncbi:MAG TPA: glycoside hydrolase family 130 protein [Terrimicrobium sp.]
MNVPVKRIPHRIEPDPRRTIARFFNPGGDPRAKAIIARVSRMPETEASALLKRVEDEFGKKHRKIREIFLEHYQAVLEFVPAATELSEARQLLIGAYFTMEYSVESAALFNPSMVPARNQIGLPEGSTRFAMSLRATGEGHVSSIVFLRGLIDKDCNISVDERSPFLRPLKVTIQPRRQEVWRQSLIAAGALSKSAAKILSGLPDGFTVEELGKALEKARAGFDTPSEYEETKENLLAVAHGNYDLEVPEDGNWSEVVIFPTSQNESRGIEDARMVRFVDDDGSVRYYATYTAYNGFRIFPQLSEHDGGRFLKIRTLMGSGARNKGMALFPRKIGGKYTMVSRLDGENLFLMQSDEVYRWEDPKLLQQPKFYWELVQIGNCGSPMETKEGWLLLTHGVGPMRQYCIGATLLDLSDPSKIIGQTEEPLLVPTAEESSGYVPNVVYTCGGMIHNELVVIPYAMSDVATSFATVELEALLKAMKAQRP